MADTLRTVDYGSVMSTAPWWGTALVAGVFGLLGVVLAQLVAVRLDRWRAAREDSKRWLDARRSTYAGFLVAVSHTQGLIYHHWDDRNRARLEGALGAVDQTYQELVLIASVTVADVARTLYFKFYDEFENWLEGNQNDPENFRTRLNRAKWTLENAARDEFGVGSSKSWPSAAYED